MVEIRASIQNMVDKLSNMDTKFDKQNKKMVMENPLLAKNLDVIDSKKMWANTFDNFYPYYEEFIKINGEKIDLDSIDSVSMDFVNKMATGIDAIAGKYQKYKDSGFSNLSDFRRNNVDRMIEMIHNKLNTLDKKVEFGISPFGIFIPFRFK